MKIIRTEDGVYWGSGIKSKDWVEFKDFPYELFWPTESTEGYDVPDGWDVKVKEIQIPCPDGNAGCCVYHTKNYAFLYKKTIRGFPSSSKTWTGNGEDNNYSNPENWGAPIPKSTEDVVIPKSKFMIPEWIKKYWKDDPAFKWFTILLIVLPPLWDVACTVVNKVVYNDPKLAVGTTVLGVTLLIIMYTIGYIKRNDP